MIRTVVIGGGVAGIAAARTLHDAGHEVLLLEALLARKVSQPAGSPPRTGARVQTRTLGPHPAQSMMRAGWLHRRSATRGRAHRRNIGVHRRPFRRELAQPRKVIWLPARGSACIRRGLPRLNERALPPLTAPTGRCRISSALMTHGARRSTRFRDTPTAQINQGLAARLGSV